MGYKISTFAPHLILASVLGLIVQTVGLKA
jgi:hypothetical protein